MITFHCSCGKKYQLPDRHAGREVRCNQCGVALLVPNQSETVAVTSETEQTSKTEPQQINTAAVEVPHTEIPPVLPKAETPEPLTPQKDTTPQDSKPDSEPGGEKDEPPPKGNSWILTIVLVLVGAGAAFFVGLVAGRALHQVGSTDHAGHFEAHEEKVTEPVTTSEPATEVAPIAEAKGYTAADWAIGENAPAPFTVKAVDGGKIQLSVDGDPTADKKNVLDDVADVLASDTDKAKAKPSHSRTLKISSESSAFFRLIWTEYGLVNLDAGKFKSIHFSLCVPDKPNAVFKPGKPEGIDKTLVLSTFGLRLVTESGFIDFIPENKEKFVAVFDRAKSGWVSVQIPISGDETWKRTDNGTFGSQTVHRIELYAQPTGTGAAVWIDNLGIEE